METRLADFMQGTVAGTEAEEILRRCVHCGFCTATCPTYQLLGDELDSPRGRIYLIKELLEGATVGAETRTHLDRCLTCRSCETTCPSGVRYGRLVDIGREVIEERAPRRAMPQRWARFLLREGMTRPRLFGFGVRLGRALRPILPRVVSAKIPKYREVGTWPRTTRQRKVLLLAGCVQPALLPSINAATARVLDALGVESLVPGGAGCCGAVRQHLANRVGALADARRNIDAWWPFVEAGAEAIVLNASGCGAMVKEYAHLLRDDESYAARARRVVELSCDLSEYLARNTDAIARLVDATQPRDAAAAVRPPATTRPRAGGTSRVASPAVLSRVALHTPCTLMHALKLPNSVEQVLAAAGIAAAKPVDDHLCCGSAGTYSLLQPELATRLRDEKLGKLCALDGPVIVSANIGCILHLQSGTETPVLHWIELLDQALSR